VAVNCSYNATFSLDNKVLRCQVFSQLEGLEKNIGFYFYEK